MPLCLLQIAANIAYIRTPQLPEQKEWMMNNMQSSYQLYRLRVEQTNFLME